MDIDILNDAKMNMTNDKINQVITEWNNERTSLKFDYSNFSSHSDKSGNITNNSEYYLNQKDGFRRIDSPIFYSFNHEYENCNLPIVNLLTLHTQNAFIINYTKVKFTYQVGAGTIKSLEIEDKEKSYVYDTYNVDFNYYTTYDKSKKEVNVSLNGDTGFCINDNAYGYYEVQLQILQNNNLRTYKFIKSFNFNSPDIDSCHINLKPIIINTLDNFQRMVF
jgi:hypothetical protein